VVATFQQGVELGAFRAETILHGYKLLAREAGADPTAAPQTQPRLTIDRLNAFIAEERQREAKETRAGGDLAGTIAPWSALAVQFLCNEIDRLSQRLDK
jgi:hypothetical protein